jgi:hypothetical protein
MRRIDRFLPRRFRAYAHELLGNVVSTQSWGIPAVARPRGWHVLFKGGWIEGIVHQIARLRRDGRVIGLAVLTDENRTMAYGEETIAGVTARVARPRLSARR